MPRKKKTLLKKLTIEAELDTSDDQVEVPKRSLRLRNSNKTILQDSSRVQKGLKNGKVHNKKVQEVETNYDADSEEEGKADGTDAENQMLTDTESENEQIKIASKVFSKPKSSPKARPLFPESKLDKENFTPPDCHSTPDVAQRVVRNLEDSLFGFNELIATLPVSPLTQASSQGVPSPATSFKYTSISSKAKYNSPTSNRKGKRKLEKQPSSLDENTKKGKKKKIKKGPQEHDDNLDEIREQFKDVEMHELVVEYC